MFQATSFTAKSLSTAYVTGEDGSDGMKWGVHQGVYPLVFFTPELLISSARWRKVLTSDIYNSRLRAFIVDESHCVKKW